MAKTYIPNELHPALLASASLNPMQQHISASRGQMYASSHLGQMLVIEGGEVRKFQSGMEREFGKRTFKVDMPADGKILHIIHRYPQSYGQNSIADNPQTILIYENAHTREIGIVNLVDYSCNHQYFGYRYKAQPGLNEIRPDAFIKQGTIFLDSPSVTQEGDYKYGLNPSVAFMTHPATAEDGIAVSDEFLKKMSFKTFETRVIEWGRKNFPLNLYGTPDNYKCFPDIGEAVRADGILMALRPYEPLELSIVRQSRLDCMEVDSTFDTLTYANGPGGRVIDVKIHHDLADWNMAKIHMDSQPQKYDAARRVFYQRIVDIYKDLAKKQGTALQITPEFHHLVVQALSVVSEGKSPRVTKQHRKAPLDTYRVEITIEYDITPGIGFKATDCYGGRTESIN